MKKTISSQHGKVISQQLAHIRKKAGLTQRELAQRLEREYSFVANYERGQRRVDLAEFFWICEACGASADKEAADIMKLLGKL